jgi:hypothetical protein
VSRAASHSTIKPVSNGPISRFHSRSADLGEPDLQLHLCLRPGYRLSDEPCTVAVGDVLHLPDPFTGFSRKDCMRWCVVTAVFGRNVRVAGRSTTRTDGVNVPQDLKDEFTKDGWVLRPAVRITLREAAAARNIGPLPDHYLQQVLFFLNEEMP